MFTDDLYKKDPLFEHIQGLSLYLKAFTEHKFLVFMIIIPLFLVVFVLFGMQKLTSQTQNLQVIPVESTTKPDALITYDISGAVKNPGVYTIEIGKPLLAAVEMAGGFSPDSSYDWVSKVINLSAPISDHQKIYIPFETEVTPEMLNEIDSQILGSYISESSTPTLTALLDANKVIPINNEILNDNVANETTESNDNLMNINKASETELETLPGIGPAYAKKLIDNRPYIDYGDLVKRSGLSSTIINKFLKLITY